MNLNVEKYGSGEPCLFIHGAGGSSGSWYFQRELQKSMEVILIDLPGHGKSPGPSLDKIEDMRDGVLETLRSLNIEKCFIAGHSMGGAIALTLALTRPEAVKGLILVGTGAKLKVMPDFLEGILRDKEGTLKQITEVAFGRNTPPAMKESGLKEMMKCEARTIYNDYYACDHFDLMDSVGDIKTPALIVCAGSDLMTPPKYSEYLSWKIKGSKIELIEGVGHMMMLERPAVLNKAIEGFVSGLSGKS
jgi:pimeloyl-ACP methyl ester carboxylesterase